MLIIKENVFLAQYTGFKIGGPADYFCEPKSKKELAGALLFARKNKIPYRVLGGRYNLLVSESIITNHLSEILFKVFCVLISLAKNI